MNAVVKIIVTLLLAILVSVPCAGASDHVRHDDSSPTSQTSISLPGNVIYSASVARADGHGVKTISHCNPDRLFVDDSNLVSIARERLVNFTVGQRSMRGQNAAVTVRPPIQHGY
jgi:hypothetical protein